MENNSSMEPELSFGVKRYLLVYYPASVYYALVRFPLG